MRKAMLKKTAVYFTAVVTECSVIIETKCFFFFAHHFFSFHLPLSSFSALALYIGFLLWWCIPSIPLLACFLFTLSVYMPLSFSLHVTFPMVSSAKISVFCPTDGPLLQEDVLFFFLLLFFFKKQTNKNLSQKSQLPILANHTTKHCNSTNNSRI